MDEESILRHLAESIERLCLVDMRYHTEEPGVVGKIHAYARKRQADVATLLAARGLVERVRAGDHVLITTGFVDTIMPHGETDGPLGAAVLAWALRQGLGAQPHLLCEAEVIPPLEACCRVLGLSAPVEAFPQEDAPAKRRGRALLEQLAPKAFITVEKAGTNHKGVAHRLRGTALTAGRARTEWLFRTLKAAGVFTVGIGDNGNELGTGLTRPAARRYLTYGRVCRCPCQGGVANADVADVTIIASISNWGAYGLEACLAALQRSTDLVHSPQTEESLITAAVAAGAVDGPVALSRNYVDAVPAYIHAHLVDMLRTMVGLYLGRVG